MNPTPTPHNAQPPQESTVVSVSKKFPPFLVSARALAETATPTPETDARCVEMGGKGSLLVSADFARRLERERDQARQQLAAVTRERDELAEIYRRDYGHSWANRNKGW